MKILVIPTTDWLKHPTPHRHHYLAERLAKNHDVYVLHFDIFSSKRKIPTKLKLIRAGKIRTEELSLYYILNAPFHLKTILKIIEREGIDVVFGAHLLPSLLGFYLSKIIRGGKRKILNVYDFSDYFPESAAVYYHSRLGKKIINYGTNMLFKMNLRCADVITTVSLPLYKLVQEIGIEDIELLTNGVDTRLFKPCLNLQSLRDALALDNNVIGFVGTIERWLDLETPIYGFKEILREIPDAKFLIVGDSIKSDYSKRLRELVQKLNLEEHVMMIGFVPYNEVPLYINLMHVTIIPFRTDLYMAKIALPDKFFEYLACGKHVLTTPISEVIRVGNDSVISYTDSKEFASKAIEMLKSNNQMNNRGIEIAKQYDWTKQTKKLEEIFKKYMETI